MNKLSFETFQIANRTRSKRFFAPAEVDNWSPADTVVGMIGELGEACNVMKKLKRAELGMVNKNKEGRQVDALTDEVRCKLMEEFGGAMLYFDQLAEHFGISWQEAIEYTYNSKSKELGFPERIYDGRFCVVEFDSGVAEEYRVVHPSAADQIHDSKYSRPYSEQPFNERNVERPDKMQTQKDEFDTLVALMRAYNNMPPIVDDDYPECRHRYEGALQQFIKALKANSRIGPEIEYEEPAPDYSKMTFSVDVEFSQHLDLNHGDRLKVHIENGKAVGVEVKERRPAAMIITEHDERRTFPGVEQARDDEIAIIYAPKERGSEIDPPEDYDRLMTITFDATTFKPTTVVKLIRKALRNRFKDYRFKTEAVM